MACSMCQIIQDGADTELYRTDDLVVCLARKRDAPLHLLAVPTAHEPTLLDLKPTLLTELLTRPILLYEDICVGAVDAMGFACTPDQLHGYRIVINEGEDGGQSAPGHVHVHLVAGIRMQGLKVDQNFIGDHLRAGKYPPDTQLTIDGADLRLNRLAPGMWVYIQTENTIDEFRYFGGDLFYWRQRNCHARFTAPVTVNASLEIVLPWPYLQTGGESHSTYSLGRIRSILVP